MNHVYMPLQLAPTAHTQPILPNWSFNLFSVSLGAMSNAQVEQKALEQAGSEPALALCLSEALRAVRCVDGKLSGNEQFAASGSVTQRVAADA